MSFNLPINGWSAMTVFMATQGNVDVDGWWDSQALIWNETELWGTTFITPSLSNVFFRFGTTQVGNQPVHPRISNIGGDFTITTAEHSGTLDSMWVNGQLPSQQGGKEADIAGTLPTAFIGAGLGNTTFPATLARSLSTTGHSRTQSARRSSTT
jgi:hypothetical protein